MLGAIRCWVRCRGRVGSVCGEHCGEIPLVTPLRVSACKGWIAVHPKCSSPACTLKLLFVAAERFGGGGRLGDRAVFADDADAMSVGWASARPLCVGVCVCQCL
jgi:hypothetical protein